MNLSKHRREDKRIMPLNWSVVFICLLFYAGVETDSPTVRLSGKKLQNNFTNKFKFICSSKMPPLNRFAEFLVNNKTEDTIRLDYDGECYNIVGKCTFNTCSCSKSGNSFTWFYQTDSSVGPVIGCEMRFLKTGERIWKMRAVIEYNGTIFVPKNRLLEYLGPPKEKDSNQGDKTENGNGNVIIDENIIINKDDGGLSTAMLAVTIIGAFTGLLLIVVIIIIVLMYKTYHRRNEGQYDINAAGNHTEDVEMTHLRESTQSTFDPAIDRSRRNRRHSTRRPRWCHLCCIKHQETLDDMTRSHNVSSVDTSNFKIDIDTSLRIAVKIEHVSKLEAIGANIKNIAPISNFRIVVAYKGQTSLNVFGKNGLEFGIELEQEPGGITYIGNTLIAVSIIKAKKIFFIEINGSEYHVSNKLDLSLLGNVYNISYNKDQLAVQVDEKGDKRIAILDLQGTVKYIIRDHEDLFAEFPRHTMHMLLYMDKNVLYTVSKENHCIFGFDFEESMLLWNIPLHNPLGIAIAEISNDDDWNILTYSKEDKFVYQINSKSNEKKKWVSITDAIDNTLQFSYFYEGGVKYLYLVGECDVIEVYKV